MDPHLQAADEYSISGVQASVPAHTDLSCRGYVTYSAISNDLKPQGLAMLDYITVRLGQWYVHYSQRLHITTTTGKLVVAC